MRAPRDDEASTGGRGRARSKSRDRKPKVRREYDTPFDEKGRCHYHKNVQLASKKMTGGWRVLCTSCPKCMEEKFSHNPDGGDDGSVRSVKSAANAAASGGKKYDANGCCVVHSHIQIAKKKVLGGGWKIMRSCPSCDGGTNLGLDDDNVSLKSGRSARSASSRKSTRSAKSSSKSKPGKASKSGRYGALPFDGDGYCCVHPSVQIAQKKMMGGFKIIHDVCPECAQEKGSSGGRSGRKTRSVSRGRRSSSRPTPRASDGNESDGGSTRRRKRIRVKNLKTEDENGRHGRYSGYVDDDHRPHGDGVMRYENGDEWEGVWHEGSQVHGRMKKGNGKKKAKESAKH